MAKAGRAVPEALLHQCAAVPPAVPYVGSTPQRANFSVNIIVLVDPSWKILGIWFFASQFVRFPNASASANTCALHPYDESAALSTQTRVTGPPWPVAGMLGSDGHW